MADLKEEISIAEARIKSLTNDKEALATKAKDFIFKNQSLQEKLADKDDRIDQL